MKAKFVIAMLALCGAVPLAAQTMTASDYVKTAGASDLFERQSSQLVLASSKNPKVRSFAQMMVRDHTKSTASVKAAAARSKVRVAPPRLTADQSAMIAALRAATGSARDLKYVEQQKMAHDQALAAQQDYATSGRAPALRTAAAGIVPVVKHHIEMLAAM